MTARSTDDNAASTSATASVTSWAEAGTQPFVCSQPFVFECQDVSCCDAYFARVVTLAVALFIIVLALIIFVVWFFSQYRPIRQRLRLGSESGGRRQSSEELEHRSKEEVHHLRRMSEMRPIYGHHTHEF